MKLPFQRICYPILIGILILYSGCSLISWHPFGTPLTREAKKEKAEISARTDVLQSAQGAVHQAAEALSAAPQSRPVDVARDFVDDAQSLLDQAVGAPSAADAAKWKTLVAGLLSENEKVRTAAESERNRDSARIAAMADKLTDATAARVEAESKVREYAKENEGLATFVRRAMWIGGIVLAIWILGQVLAVAAKFYPPAAAMSIAVNGIAAPMHTILNAAESKVRAAVVSELAPKQ